MAKKDQQAAGSIEDPQPDPTEKEYTEGIWAGLPHFACKQCAFDAVDDRFSMLEHLIYRHGSEAALEEEVALQKAGLLPMMPPLAVQNEEEAKPPAAVIELSQDEVQKLIDQANQNNQTDPQGETNDDKNTAG